MEPFSLDYPRQMSLFDKRKDCVNPLDWLKDFTEASLYIVFKGVCGVLQTVSYNCTRHGLNEAEKVSWKNDQRYLQLVAT